jgi:hypothetical protein
MSHPPIGVDLGVDRGAEGVTGVVDRRNHPMEGKATTTAVAHIVEAQRDAYDDVPL